jgi:hypothetical protein
MISEHLHSNESLNGVIKLLTLQAKVLGQKVPGADTMPVLKPREALS